MNVPWPGIFKPRLSLGTSGVQGSEHSSWLSSGGSLPSREHLTRLGDTVGCHESQDGYEGTAGL